jgi:hypothetical protein
VTNQRLPCPPYRSGYPGGNLGIALIVGLWWISDVASSFAQPPLPPQPVVPEIAEGQRQLTAELLADRPITTLRATLATTAPSQPDNLARQTLAQEPARHQPSGLGRGWCLQPVTFDASAARHLPLYFEEPNLERLGYHYGCGTDGSLGRALSDQWFCWSGHRCGLAADSPPQQVLQPFVSAFAFYGRILTLPYQMGVRHPTDEIYALGTDRPGSPVPYRTHRIPLSLRGALYQGATATGTAFIVP